MTGYLGSFNSTHGEFIEIMKNVDVKFMVGSHNYAFIYLKNRDLYTIGSNKFGQLGLGKDIMEENNIKLISNDKDIDKIF